MLSYCICLQALDLVDSDEANGTSRRPSEVATDIFANLNLDEQNQQLDFVQAARFRRTLCFVLLFAWKQSLSFYTGVKLVDFDFGSNVSVLFQASLMGFVIVLINIRTCVLFF